MNGIEETRSRKEERQGNWISEGESSESEWGRVEKW